MRILQKSLAIFLTVVWSFFLVGVLIDLLAQPAKGLTGWTVNKSGVVASLALVLVLVMIYGWILYAFFHYRIGRQEEILQLLVTAVGAGLPVSPVLRAYLRDRPHGRERETWVAIFLNLFMPGYYWVWYRQHNFDLKVARVADLLDQGVPLHRALRAEPGVVSREAVMATAVGQATGQLARCLQNSARRRLAAVWVQLVPRFLYPVVLLLFIAGLTAFWLDQVAPRLQRIYKEFHRVLPNNTLQIMALEQWDTLLDEYSGEISLAAWVIAVVVLLLLLSSTVRWYFPGVGLLYRMEMRGRVMKMLAVLFDTGKPAPEALALLAESGYFPGAVRSRLAGSRRLVEQGVPLAASLRARGLVSAGFVPLLNAAEQMRNLPWALSELGDALGDRAVRRLQRVSMVVAPLVLVLVGTLAGYVIVAMFMPLIDLVTALS